MMQDNFFILDRFLEGARETAKNLESAWKVSPRVGEFKDIGGCGLIMDQLIDIIEDYKSGKGSKYDGPIPI